MKNPLKDPRDPAYRPPLDRALPWPPTGPVDHPNLKELLYANLSPQQVVADIGCGPGPFEYDQFPPHFIAFDAFQPETTQGIVVGRDEIRIGRLEQFPLEDASVDAVILGFILEHVPEPGVFLREAERALKPGGWCYVAVPNHQSLEDRLFRLATRWAGSTRGPHIQRFTFDNFQDLMRQQTGLKLQAWHLLQSSFLWMQHPKLRWLRKPWVALLKALQVVGLDLLKTGNYQFLLRKPQ